MLDRVSSEDGYISLSGSSPGYHYYLTDHLGNVRSVLSPSGSSFTVVQQQDYYPYGLRKSLAGATQNLYLYNGKEIQGELGGQYDYGARFYDPVIGRWNVVDLMAEVFDNVSPYAYGMDNPIRFTDPDGMFATDSITWQDIKPAPKPADASLVVPGIPMATIILEEVVVTAGRAITRAASAATSGIGMTIGLIFLPANWQAETNYWEIDPKTYIPPPILIPGTDRNNPATPTTVSYTPPPRELSGFPGAKRVPSQGRARWRTEDGKILEWDSQHGDVEVYNRQGKHQGSANPNTGEMTKPPVPGRTTRN